MGQGQSKATRRKTTSAKSSGKLLLEAYREYEGDEVFRGEIQEVALNICGIVQENYYLLSTLDDPCVERDFCFYIIIDKRQPQNKVCFCSAIIFGTNFLCFSYWHSFRGHVLGTPNLR